jgi:MFS family permease
VIGVAPAVFQQITGVNTVIYYAPTLLQGAGLGSSSANLAAVCVGGVNVFLTIVGVRLMDRVGRRPLLLIGTSGMLLGLLNVAGAFLGGDQLTGSATIVAVIGLFSFQGSLAIGLGPVFWLLIAEIYPLRIRSLKRRVSACRRSRRTSRPRMPLTTTVKQPPRVPTSPRAVPDIRHAEDSRNSTFGRRERQLQAA